MADALTTAAQAIARHLETLIKLERDRNELLAELVKVQTEPATSRTVTLGQAER